jgi:hypothetical protein
MVMMISVEISMQDSNPTIIPLNEGEKSIFSPSSYDTKSQVDMDVLWKKIYDVLTVILASEFSSEIKREPRPHKDRISFACVYCGDSANDPRKKRGNLFAATMQYHCFNGDCSTHMSIYNFLRDKNMLAGFTPDELVVMKETGSQRSLDLKKIKASLGLETFFSDEIEDLSVDREFLMKKLGLHEIRGSRIEKYLRERLQTEFHHFGWDPKKGLLYVMNMNRSDDRVLGLQIKTFNKRNPYLTWKITRIHEELGIFKEENREMLEKMDFLSNIFGIFKVDLNKTLTVFEGPLDSFLFPNSVALCSAKNSLPFEIEGARYFYDNDATGREWSVRRITEGKSVFLWRKYIEENELLDYQHKIKDLNDLLIFIRRARKPHKRFVDYFSDSRYDAIWI